MPNCTPEETLLEILHGVKQFNQTSFLSQRELFAKLANSQSPKTLFITCSDSRINPELLTNQPPGSLFILRNIGNIIPTYESETPSVTAAIEYAVCVLKVSTIIVCGHSNCGAMGGLMDPKRLSNLPDVENWLRQAKSARSMAQSMIASDLGPEHIKDLTEANILLQLKHLRTYPIVHQALEHNILTLQGWYYDIPLGTVRVLNEETQTDMDINQAIEQINKNLSL